MLHKMTVVALALGTAMTLSAQQGPGGPEGPHGPGFGPGPRMGFGPMGIGPGGRGGPGGGLVTNQPYSATESRTDTMTRKDGKTVTHQSTEQNWRDAAGRTRHEVIVPAEGKRPEQHRAEIFDPVKHTVTMLDLTRKTAIVRQLPEPRGERRQRPEGEARERKLPPNVTETDLPGKQIAGVYATGKQITHTVPAGQHGNAEPIVQTSQIYTSPDLKIVLFASENGPHNNLVRQVTELNRADPNSALFEVPGDFTIKSAPERGPGFRGRRGPGGPGGPPPADGPQAE